MRTAEEAVLSRRRPPGRLAQTVVLARRNLLHLRTDPAQVVSMAIQPGVFLLMFVFVLGGAISGSPEAYLRFAVGGQLVLMAVLNAVQTAPRVAQDSRGVGERFRALPVAPVAVIGGRLIADAIRILWGAVILVVFAVILGFRFNAGVGDVILALALTAWVGLGLCAAMAFAGTVARGPDTAGPWAFLIAFPLIFASSIFAPISSMPAWLTSLAEVNPVTVMTDAIRSLITGAPGGGQVRTAVLLAGGAAVIFGALATWRFRRGT